MRIGITGEEGCLSGPLRDALDTRPFLTVATERAEADIIVSAQTNGHSSAEALHLTAQAHPELPVLVIAERITPIDIRRILTMGASGILLQETAAQHVSWAIPAVLNDCRVLSPEISESLISECLGSWPAAPQEQSARERIHRLSRREREVLHLLGQGMSNREIARCLFISPETVKDHVRSLRTKLGAPTRVHAARVAWLARGAANGNAA
ncbi:DNA-binding response regulator [Streptomyces sp. NPDC093094]|uniref:response regulator transcription factor n=1 Tax=Streptomyces sp. NPDC093094 TaxID=3366026 RepID=UPI003820F1BF